MIGKKIHPIIVKIKILIKIFSNLEENNIRVNMRPNPEVKNNQMINQRLRI